MQTLLPWTKTALGLVMLAGIVGQSIVTYRDLQRFNIIAVRDDHLLLHPHRAVVTSLIALIFFLGSAAWSVFFLADGSAAWTSVLGELLRLLTFAVLMGVLSIFAPLVGAALAAYLLYSLARHGQAQTLPIASKLLAWIFPTSSQSPWPGFLFTAIWAIAALALPIYELIGARLFHGLSLGKRRRRSRT